MKIFTILYVFLQGIAVATAQKLPQPFEVDLHIKQKQIGLLDPFEAEIVLKNIDKAAHPVVVPTLVLPYISSDSIFVLHSAEAFLEFRKKRQKKWKHYLKISSNLNKPTYFNAPPKSEFKSGFFRVNPALFFSNNTKAVDSAIISKPGNYLFRIGYKLLQPNTQEIIYSKPIKVYIHDYKSNRSDHDAYLYLKNTPYPFFLTRHEGSLNPSAMDIAPYAKVIAIEYPKSKFAPWANLILYEASWFSIAVEKEKIQDKQAVAQAAQSLKKYRDIIMFYGNEIVKKKMEWINFVIYWDVLQFLYNYDEEKMKEDDLYKQIFVY